MSETITTSGGVSGQQDTQDAGWREVEMMLGHPLLAEIPHHEDQLKQQIALSVLIPVYNERHLVAASVKRVLALQSPHISRLEVIIVDDRSKDGSWEILQQLAAADKRICLYRHEKNSGKGAAIRTALEKATGDVCIVHDADLEYNPADIPPLLKPFIEEGADAVFGSRYLSSEYRRALMYRHTQINKTITTLTNWFTDLNLSDVETCYKAIKTSLLRSIPIRSNDFRFEIEITMKLVKRRARIFEVPIRYLPRTYEEGKKIGPKDGLRALQAMVKWSFIDDMYREDEFGSAILTDLQHARRQNKWLADTLRPLLGDRILEIGAGIGTLTSQFIPRELYVAADNNVHYLEYLRTYSFGKPYLRILPLDPTNPAEFESLEGHFDTVLLINQLERMPDEQQALRNANAALVSGGRVIVAVPQEPKRANELDKAMGHRERYTRASLEAALNRAGFKVENMLDFNRAAAVSWKLTGSIRKHTKFSRPHLKAMETLTPLARKVDALLPWSGLNLIAVAVKE